MEELAGARFAVKCSRSGLFVHESSLVRLAVLRDRHGFVQECFPHHREA